MSKNKVKLQAENIRKLNGLVEELVKYMEAQLKDCSNDFFAGKSSQRACEFLNKKLNARSHYTKKEIKYSQVALDYKIRFNKGAMEYYKIEMDMCSDYKDYDNALCKYNQANIFVMAYETMLGSIRARISELIPISTSTT